MERQTKIPAIFDETNLCEDAVLGNIFDDGNYIERPNQTGKRNFFVGFVVNAPCFCIVDEDTNMLHLRFQPILYSEIKAVKDRLLTDYGDGLKTEVHYEYNNLLSADCFDVEYFLDENYF